MILRSAMQGVTTLLSEFPAVALLGPRQIGKTTLAREIAKTFSPEPLYLDLEMPSDAAKLREPEEYFELHKGKLIILDEIQQIPGLFQILRGIIDRRRREGNRVSQFLMLGSASLDLLNQSSESLAGRIAYYYLPGINVSELPVDTLTGTDNLWLRGGFPDSFLAKTDESSFRWREHFISTYLERDVPQLGNRIPAVSLRLLWTMLAHNQGGQINTSQLARNLDVASPTAKRYLELLEDLLLVRTLRPWSGNVGKRLVKLPKIYIRDSGLTHALLNISSHDDLLGHPVVGQSWEGFVLENLIPSLPEGITPWYYRTSAGAEIDLVVEKNTKERYAIEIKRSRSPSVSKGFYLGCEDVRATKKFIVYSGDERFPLTKEVTAISVKEMLKELQR